MKSMIRACAMVVVCSVLSVKVYAQDFDKLIKGSTKDANILVQGYLSPALKAFATGLNQGWYNTAKTHKKFGFDLTFSVAGVMIPSSEKFFTVDNGQLTEIALDTDHDDNSVSADGKGRVPTLFGPTSTKSKYAFKDPQNGAGTFDGLEGIDLKDEIGVNFLPVPVFSLGFGLPKSIELRFRFIPTINIGDDEGKINYFGVGVMHDVKQYIPGIKMLPFDLSAFAGHTRMSVTAQIGDPNSPDYDPSQKGEFVVSATTIQGLISKKVSVLTVYGGVGYNIAKSTLKAKGDYDLDDDGINDVTDPLNLSVSSSGPRMTAGIRLKFAFFTLHGDYTLQKFSTFSAGFGINVR